MAHPIGTRYVPKHVVRRDSVTGLYEELNSPVTTTAERLLQDILILKIDKPSWVEPATMLILILVMVFALFHLVK